MNDEALTRQRFLANPFTQAEGDRLYRTGDLGCYLPNGTVEFLGRGDHQVKLRGFRIEPGEIEAVLRRCSEVRDCLVILREDSPGEERLVAYIVAHQGQSIANHELRRLLKEQLPEYMVPTAFVFLEQLPLTPNGKIDRPALPPPDVERSHGQGSSAIEARTPVEEVVAALWSEILHLNTIGVHDNFFELGGHSLLALMLSARLREAFQVDLSLRNLFENPTVAGQAELVEQRQGRETASSQAPISWPRITPRPDQISLPFPLTDVQQAYWIGRMGAFELGNVARHFYVELEGEALDLPRLNAAWQRLIERHAMLRAIVLPDGQQQILEHLPPYEIVALDLRGASPSEASARLEGIRQSMSHQMLATDRWPLFDLRATYLDDQRVRLHLSAESPDAQCGKLADSYARTLAALLPSSHGVPQLDLSFRDYVLAEIAFHASDAYQRSQNYWWQRISTLPPAPELPLFNTPASLSEPRFVRRQGRLEPEAWSRLKQKAARAGLTPSTVLLAAFAEILGAWSKQPHFTINLTLFNRLPLHPQVNDILGDFTSLTFLEIDNRLSDSFRTACHADPGASLGRPGSPLCGWDSGPARDAAQPPGGTFGAVMPVVFTSTPTQSQTAGTSPLLGKTVYHISQTPQVWLDHQVTETGWRAALQLGCRRRALPSRPPG